MAKRSKPVKNTILHESDEHLGRQIEIKCIGSDLIEIDELTDFQGKLKKLSEEAYQRLKQSILTLGFSFPIAAWKYRNKTMILDAHQRVATLKRMRQEGYVIPKIPIVEVEAKDQKEAARKVLAATSQYGEIQVDGLHSFMDEFKISMPDLEESFKFPEIDFDAFKFTYFDESENPVVVGENNQPLEKPETVLRQNPEKKQGLMDVSNEQVNDLKINFSEKCPHCGGDL